MDQQPDVISRIADREAARRDKLATVEVERQQDTGKDAAQAEAQLGAMHLAIDTQLRAGSGEFADSVDVSVVSKELDELELLLQGRSWLLQPYTLRKAEEGIQDLRKRLDSARAAQRPKKRFGFSSRVRTAPAGAAAAVPPAAAPTAAPPFVSEDAQPLPDRSLCGLGGETVVRSGSELDGKDFDVRDAEGCTISLLGRMTALRLRGVRRCRIVAGPVDGAVYLEDVHDSLILLAAHQVRIHTSNDSQLLLDVGSNPIIEHCTGIGFASLPSAHRQQLGLPAPGGLNSFANVQDFNWLRPTQSPNWRLLSRDEVDGLPCPPLVGA